MDSPLRHALIGKEYDDLKKCSLFPASLFDRVHAFLQRFVAYPSEHDAVAHTLWIVHTHFMDAWESTPRLAFLSPEPASGKTRALEITETLVPRPIEAVSASAAALFRKAADPAGLPTILYDEIDTIFGPHAKEHEEIRGFLNAGHRRGAKCYRCVIGGKRVRVEEIPAFCAVGLAGIGDLPDTILTRSVVIPMKRRAPHEMVEPYRRRVHAPEGNLLRECLARWAKEASRLIDTCPKLPDCVADRDADVWEPLIALADAAGGEWPDRARVTAVTAVTASREMKESLGVRLLKDVKCVFNGNEALHSNIICNLLISLEEAPWANLKLRGDKVGRPLDPSGLAGLLRRYKIRSDTIRIGGKLLKGYRKDSFHDAWARYLPGDSSLFGHNDVTPVTDYPASWDEV